MDTDMGIGTDGMDLAGLDWERSRPASKYLLLLCEFMRETETELLNKRIPLQ